MSKRVLSKDLFLKDYIILAILEEMPCKLIELQDLFKISKTSMIYRVEKLKRLGLVKTYRKSLNQPVIVISKNKIKKEEIERRFKEEIKTNKVMLNFMKNGGYLQLKSKLYIPNS